VQGFRQRDGSTRIAVVLGFEKAGRKLICNKTQCFTLASITGSATFTDWVGHTVALSPSTAPNGKPTIAVLANTQEA